MTNETDWLSPQHLSGNILLKYYFTTHLHKENIEDIDSAQEAFSSHILTSSTKILFHSFSCSSDIILLRKLGRIKVTGWGYTGHLYSV